MKKIILIGPVSSGKSTLCRALNNINGGTSAKKTQSIEILGSVIDTPGEYLGNRMLYRALAVTALQADFVLLLQDCTHGISLYPALFSDMFPAKTVLGVVSKIDAAADEKQIHDARQKLLEAGAVKVFNVSALSGEGVEDLRKYVSGN
ncbi:MAG: EutP/PduV family microcompartment system protein [Clostridiales bacterium]|jgi:ethanolamine utilization protein EutP|nr:EutP/PduV family microcompartment system protein [Clostridiales bacterium]